MLGLNAPRTKSSIDEVLDIAEDVMRAFIFEYRKAAVRDLQEITLLDNRIFRDQIRAIAKTKFQEFALLLKDPITNVLQSIRAESSTLRPPTAKTTIPYASHTNPPRLNKTQSASTPNLAVNPRLISTNEKALQSVELKFQRLNEFVEYPTDVRGIKKLTVDLPSQGIADNGLPHFGSKLSMYSGCSQLFMNLSMNSITQKGAEFISIGLQDLKNLQTVHLNFYNNKIKHKGLAAILQPIVKHGVLMKDFRLDLACNQIGSAGLSKIGEAITSFRGLETLSLGLYDNQIKDDGLQDFLDAFLKCPQYSTFFIDLRVNPMQKQLVEKLKTVIKHKKIINFQVVV